MYASDGLVREYVSRNTTPQLGNSHAPFRLNNPATDDVILIVS